MHPFQRFELGVRDSGLRNDQQIYVAVVGPEVAEGQRAAGVYAMEIVGEGFADGGDKGLEEISDVVWKVVARRNVSPPACSYRLQAGLARGLSVGGA
jgi:hypothetical protein